MTVRRGEGEVEGEEDVVEAKGVEGAGRRPRHSSHISVSAPPPLADVTMHVASRSRDSTSSHASSAYYMGLISTPRTRMLLHRCAHLRLFH